MQQVTVITKGKPSYSLCSGQWKEHTIEFYNAATQEGRITLTSVAHINGYAAGGGITLDAFFTDKSTLTIKEVKTFLVIEVQGEC